MINYYELLKKHALLLYGKKAYSLNNKERMNVLCAVLKEQMTESLSATRLNSNDKKEVHYFSAEFLLGKQIDSILENLGTKDQLLEALELINWDYNEILEIEPEPSTGNGGLGRLAACFIDSMAALGFDGFGQGIRYRKGLFRQKFVNGEQRELPDPWLANGQYPLDFKMDGEEVIVKLRGSVRFETVNGRLHAVLENYKPIMAVPYDIPAFEITGILAPFF
jgi:starch phosphorylase